MKTSNTNVSLGSGVYAKVLLNTEGEALKLFRRLDKICPFELELLMREKECPHLASGLGLLMVGAQFGVRMTNYGSAIKIVNPELMVEVARQIDTALGWLHTRGILHLDISRGNVLVDDSMHVTVCDFGLSLQLGPGKDAVFDTAERVSTDYRPPEVGPRHYPGPELDQIGDGACQVGSDMLKGFIYNKFVDYYSTGKVLERSIPAQPKSKKNKAARIEMSMDEKRIRFMAYTLQNTNEPNDRKFVYPGDVTDEELETARRLSCCDYVFPQVRRVGIYAGGAVGFILSTPETRCKPQLNGTGEKWKLLRRLAYRLLESRTDASLICICKFADIVAAHKLVAIRSLAAAFTIAVNYCNCSHYFESCCMDQIDETTIAHIHILAKGNHSLSVTSSLQDPGELVAVVSQLFSNNWGSPVAYEGELPFRNILLRDHCSV